MTECPQRVFDRCGVKASEATPLFFHDYSDDVVPWIPTNVVSGNGTAVFSIEKTPGQFLTGKGALKLVTPPGATYSGKYTEAHIFAPRVAGRPVHYFGGRYAYKDENAAYLSLYNGYSDANEWDSVSLTHHYATNLYSYNDGEAGSSHNETLYEEVTGANTSTPRWHDFLIVADFDAKRILSVHSDKQEFSAKVSQKQVRQVLVPTAPTFADLAIEIGYTSGTPVAATVLFDELWAIAGPTR